ncbi:MAG: TonB-dependent receptor, partial [Acidobacteria bacterium]|nr:TonB-dependent receptor [Acidobacteriota bacterium]
RYVAAELPPGPYEFTATMTGFDTLVRSGITLTVGANIALNMTMQVGSVSTQVTVTGEAPLVNTTTAGVSGVVEEFRITELPLNGRDFGQLALVGTNALEVRTARGGSAAKGYGTRLALSGSRPQDTGWTLDGTSVNSVGNFGTPGSSSGTILGVDAIREFRVVTGGGYSAEYGGYAGGVVQMITKSGTNQFHGTAFALHRNDNMDARSFFDVDKPEFRRNQFGGSLGGPAMQDKLFFFGAYEGLRQAKTGETAREFVPDLDIRNGILPDGTQVEIAPQIKPYLDLWPLPNAESIGGGVAVRNTPVDTITDEDYWITRVDYTINDNQRLFGRFQMDNAENDNPRGLGIYNTTVRSTQRFTTLQWENIMSPTLLSSSSFSFNRTRLNPNIKLNINYPESLFIPWHSIPPQFSYSGVDTFGVSDRPTHRTQNKWEMSQSFSYARGAHAYKFGVSYAKIGFNTNGPAAGAFGSFSYDSEEDFLTDSIVETFQVEVEGADTARTVRQNVFGFYFQDDWQLRPNFTLNMGMRYEPYLSPTEKWGRVSTYLDYVTQTQFSNPKTDGTDTYFDSPGEKNFSPRLGFAWDVKGDGKTAIRAGAGIYHILILSPYLNTIVRKNPPDAGTLIADAATNLAGAVEFARAATPNIRSLTLSPSTFSEFIQHQMHPSYDIKFNLSVEREITRDLSATLGYVGGQASNLTMKADCNARPSIQVGGRPFVVSGTPRLNPNNGVITCSLPAAKSFYNAMTFELKKRMSRGFQFQTSYTWSKTIDDASTGLGNSDFGEGVATQPYNQQADRGLAATHLSHNFSVNGVWSLPSPVSEGLAYHLFGGWQISSIFRATSGIPVRVELRGRAAPDGSRSSSNQHPELAPGFHGDSIWTGTSAGCADKLGDDLKFAGDKLGTPDRWYDPCAFTLPPPAPDGLSGGFYGNTGRNTIVGPGFVNIDFSVKKNTSIGLSESSTLMFHADFFNLFNHTNFGTPRDRAVRIRSGRRLTRESNAGKITSTSSSERQIQFGLKLVF